MACGCRLPECTRTNCRISVSDFCGYALGREGPFEGYCSEGVEHFESRASVAVRQYYSREMPCRLTLRQPKLTILPGSS